MQNSVTAIAAPRSPIVLRPISQTSSPATAKSSDRDELQRQHAAAGDREDERGEQRLERAPVALPPEEGGQFAVERMPRHQADDGLVGVEDAERVRDKDAGAESDGDDCREREHRGGAGAHAGRVLSSSAIPPASRKGKKLRACSTTA